MVMNLFKLAALATISLLLSVSCVKEESTNNPGNKTETDNTTDKDPDTDPGTNPDTNPVADFKLSRRGSDSPMLKNDKVDMIWYEYDNCWAFYIDIESKLEWELNDLPEWLGSSVTNITKTSYEVDLVADLAKLPVTGDKATVSFKNKENEETLFSFELNLPSSEKLIDCPYFRSSIEFYENGMLTSATDESDRIYSGTVISVEGTRLYAVSKTGNTMAVVTDDEGTAKGWCHITVQDPWKDGGAKIQSVKYGFSVEENTTSDTRVASIVAVPKSLRSDSFDPAKDLFTDDKSALRSELKLVSTITQHGKPFSNIETSDCEFRPIEEGGNFYEEGKVYKYLKADIFDGRPVYVLNFTGNNGSLTARYNGDNIAVVQYHIFDGPYISEKEAFAPLITPDQTDKSYFEVSLVPDNIGSGIQRYLIEVWGYSDLHDPNAERPTAFIYVIYNPAS